MKLVSFQKLSAHRGAPRLWIESARLTRLGLPSGTPLRIEIGARKLCLREKAGGSHHVSGRRACGGLRPIIDLNSQALAALAEYEEVRITGTHGLLSVEPSVRAFNIHASLNRQGPLRVLECFCGGGTMTAAMDGNPNFQVVAGLEIEPDYADVWQAAHPDADIYQTDIRLVHPSELPDHEIFVAGIPCTSHSGLGRAKKSLAGKPELGDTGDLFIPALNIIANRMPAAVLFENVANFGASLAGLTIKSNLEKLGYHVSDQILSPHEQWAEPSDRRRWLCVATLEEGFKLSPPLTPFAGRSGDFLDAADDARDREDAERIANTIEGLRKHNARHAAQGHGFAFTTLNGSEDRIPVIPKSYHKINTGPFVETKFGLRMLRKAEIERIQGCEVKCDSYAVAVQILGQGVQTRVFRQIFNQLGNFLCQI
jgi:site-specific DNA-cytosine methylase